MCAPFKWGLRGELCLRPCWETAPVGSALSSWLRQRWACLLESSVSELLPSGPDLPGPSWNWLWFGLAAGPGREYGAEGRADSCPLKVLSSEVF